MPNEVGKERVDRFRKARVLTARQINQIVDSHLLRGLGGKGINVSSFSGNLIVSDNSL